MRMIEVAPSDKSYPVFIGSGLLAQAGHYLSEKGFSGKLVIITDPQVNSLYGEKLRRRLSKKGFQVSTLLVPQGEEQKSLRSAGRLYRKRYCRPVQTDERLQRAASFRLGRVRSSGGAARN